MDIITVKEVVDFLRLKEATVCRLASEGKLPGVKVGKSWRFDRAALERLVTGVQSEMIGFMDGATKNEPRKASTESQAQAG